MVTSDLTSCRKTFSSKYLSRLTLKPAPHTTCTPSLHPSPPLPSPSPTRSTLNPFPRRAAVQHSSPSFGLLQLTLSSAAPHPAAHVPQAHGPQCHSPAVRCTPSSPWMHAGLAQSSSPIPGFPSAMAPFFFKLHFTSKSHAQLLVWVQSQETLQYMWEGS